MRRTDAFICSSCGEMVKLYAVEGRPGHFMSSHDCPGCRTCHNRRTVRVRATEFDQHGAEKTTEFDSPCFSCCTDVRCTPESEPREQ